MSKKKQLIWSHFTKIKILSSILRLKTIRDFITIIRSSSSSRRQNRISLESDEHFVSISCFYEGPFLFFNLSYFILCLILYHPGLLIKELLNKITDWSFNLLFIFLSMSSRDSMCVYSSL